MDLRKQTRTPLPRSTQLRLYLGSTIALIVLMLLGYRLGINLALPAFISFLVFVTIVGARQERAAHQQDEVPQALRGEEH
ncbi:MAG: hypothetical protein D6791_10795 [Chloroflexi bacterium]|nr:MAG: hypothetical protein D6791_10795 [Chloroflexota bacterium]